ncbi:MAG: aminomethyl-transferring glycine dehydrogenase subunit GcvPB [Planctomycetes bacterium]|nr:aminomethyl-transferring glycine dehydrogenase subunit GcvPB [Planctomycetota bacterium]
MHEVDKRTIFEKTSLGKRATIMPKADFEYQNLDSLIPREYQRAEKVGLPELSEIEIMRHFNNLACKNMGVDTNFYPLGSCTMKYNPRINEKIATIPAFTATHPYQPFESVQGMLRWMHELQDMFSEIAGLDACTLAPAAGAHGELAGLMLIKAYHKHNNDEKRSKILIPDSAHGTNPASVVLAGMKPIELKSGTNGKIDLEDLKSKLDDTVAGMMVTNPNTLGLFETEIASVAQMLHNAGAMLYMDGANMNALSGIARPGDFGVDVMHYNVHKTWSTPHGGGGPGGGPVACVTLLEPFLPIPRIIQDEENGYRFSEKNFPLSIGRIKQFYGNIGVLLKSYVYLKTLGSEGVKNMSEMAVLNANYLRVLLNKSFDIPFDEICLHEAVFTDKIQKQNHVTTKDIGKRLLDFGFHAPTTYFPLIVHGALMIEPTETESKDTIERFVDAMHKIAEEAKTNPEIVKTAPHNCPVKRVDDVRATKIPIVKYEDITEEF